MVRCLVIDPSVEKMTVPEVVEIDDFHEFLREHNPGCRCIGCASRYFNGVPYDIWHDDEFLFHGGAPSVITTDYEEIFFGCVVICNVDEETGESSDLSDEDIRDLLDCPAIVKIVGRETPLWALRCTVFPPAEEEVSE